MVKTDLEFGDRVRGKSLHRRGVDDLVAAVGEVDDHHKPILGSVGIVVEKEEEFLGDTAPGIFNTGQPGEEPELVGLYGKVVLRLFIKAGQ